MEKPTAPFFCTLISVPLLVTSVASAVPRAIPDWSEGATIPLEGRANPYAWDEPEMEVVKREGLLHALNYPVQVTGFLMPERVTLKLLDEKPGHPIFQFLRTILWSVSPADFKGFQGFWNWLGLSDYPVQSPDFPFVGEYPNAPMGVSRIHRKGTVGITLGCASCHVGSLFGKPVMGLSTRFSEANTLFFHAQTSARVLSPHAFRALSRASISETDLYAEFRERIASVGVVKPKALGLDTSLAQVSLSLSKRRLSPWAELDPLTASQPRPNPLTHQVADSKPAVWWTLKYKNRWLSDGSVVSGNPVLTNFLWNEIGRGADLHEVSEWIDQNESVIESLTTAIFATRAPRWRDFLPVEKLRVQSAQKGQALFAQSCQSCHGQYDKAWDLSSFEFKKRQLADPRFSLTDTVRVLYPTKTPVKNVGTDRGRARGMEKLALDLNPLAFSQSHQIKIVPQKGYVPPPLDGIFARFPYFHNNSIPNLCALMTPPSRRPSYYYSGEVLDPLKDYDQDCVGYPVGRKTPLQWLNAKDAQRHLFDTRIEGLSNAGHYEGIFNDEDGKERFTPAQKRNLIDFLLTL